MVSVILVLLGLLSLLTLPVTQFPDIAPPSVQVTASYPGANAEVVARSVATPIEEAVNGVENMTYMNSTSNNDGSMALTVYFKLGTDPDLAAVNVQNRVSKAMSLLPAEVVQAGVSTQKQQNSMIHGGEPGERMRRAMMKHFCRTMPRSTSFPKYSGYKV